MVREGKHIIQIKDNSLRYPTGEVVPIEFKVMAKVLLGRYFVEIPMYVIDMDDDCLLGVDFLRKINLENVFESAFVSSESEEEKVLSCSRIQVSSGRAPFLKELYTNNSSNLNEAQKEIFTDFLEEYQDVFSEEIVAGNCGVVEHVINLEDSSPIKQVPRRIPLRMREEVEKIIEEMRKQGVIEESQSPWVSPAVLVRKKDGTLRFCVDYRMVNAITKKDSFPLPRIDDIFDQLSGNFWFCTLDLKSGYWQVKIRLEDREKTAFSIGRGLWWLMSFKDLEGQLARWLERLQQYEFEIIHRKGLIHKNADGLSRRQCESFGCEYCVKVERRQMEESRKSVARIILIGETLQDWRKEQLEDVSIAFIYRGKETGIRPSRFEIPAGDVSARIYWSYWDALSLKDGVLYKRLQMDILGPLPITTSGNRYLLVIVDCFTKWVEAFPLRNIRASTVAEVFVNQVISRHGVPLEVHTDQGKNFESKLFAELMNLLGIRKTRTTALHPQSDGQVERQHQTIVNYLAKSSKHETTEVTPAELYFARDLRLPLDLLLGSPPRGGSQSVGGFIGNLKEKLDRIHSNVRERMDKFTEAEAAVTPRRVGHLGSWFVAEPNTGEG
ncbi:uncharacterized protein [Temnothorax nylanderi]|uniref:uncharacterized protein n=1 Tax=Temnothorax nylanderi TaxID=102681 RepID=UPI003A8A58B8